MNRQECWDSLFTNQVTGGYEKCWFNGSSRYAHRLSYESLVGPIPNGLTIDHLCRNTHCINPDHLEPVTMRENILRGFGICGNNARKTHCKYGHNRWSKLKDGRRRCLDCHLNDTKKRRYEG